MKITLNNITLTNFKGVEKLTVGFAPTVTDVYGANGAGKTRLFDAFLWLLFGKDHLDRKDYEIKSTNRTNREDECSVEAELSVDGQVITLKRALVEDWTKPRGQAEPVYSGNHTECWWNGSPVKVGEYKQQVEGLISEDLFRMLTNPHYFTSQNWKIQRDMLMKIAGVRTDVEIAAERAEFAELAKVLSGKSLSDWKSELQSQKRLTKNQLEAIAPKIEQVDKMRPQAQDWELLQQQLSATEKEISKIDRFLADRTEAAKAAAKELDEKLADIRVERASIRQQIDEQVTTAKNDEKKRVALANERYEQLIAERSSKYYEASNAELELIRIAQRQQRLADEIAAIDAKLDSLRHEWAELNAQEYSADSCPVCGQEWPEQIAQTKREDFNRRKAEELERINNRGKDLKADKELLLDEQQQLAQQRAEQYAQAELLRGRVGDIDKELAQMQPEQERDIQEDAIPAIVELKAKMQAIEEAYNELINNNKTPSAASEEELNRKRELQLQRDEYKNKLGERDLIAKCDREVATLRESERTLAQQLADLEQQEFLVQQFTQAKIDECENKINGLFSLIRFKFFDKTIAGDLVETCEATIDGKPYGTVNNASQINAGLDIIKALSKTYDVYAPIFIDNRESVTKIIPMDTQIINLIVSEADVQLRVISDVVFDKN